MYEMKASSADAQRQRREDEPLQAVPAGREEAQRHVADAVQGQPLELEAEDPQEHGAEHERGDAPEHERQGGERRGPDAVLSQRRVHAEGDAEQRDEQGGHGELDGDGRGLRDQLADRTAGVEGHSQIAARRRLEVLDVLHVERPVEAALVTDERDAFRGRQLARQRASRVARRDLEHAEGDESDAQQDDGELEQTPDEVGDHDHIMVPGAAGATGASSRSPSADRRARACYTPVPAWATSSVGRARARQARGRWFNSNVAHHFFARHHRGGSAREVRAAMRLALRALR